MTVEEELRRLAFETTFTYSNEFISD